MKIVQFISSLSNGGAETLVTNLAINMSNNHLVKVYSSYDNIDTENADKIRQKKIELVEFSKKRGFDIKLILKILKQLNQDKPDVIHSHLDTIKYVYFPAKILMIPIVYTQHNLAEKEASGKLKYLYKYIFKDKHVTSVSICEEVRKSFVNQYKFKKENIPLVYNGIDFDEFYTDRTRISKNKNILCVATFKEQKNHKFLIDVFSDVLVKEPQAKLFLVGDGILKKQIEHYVVNKKMENSIIFMGNRNDINRIMKGMSIFVLLSKYEGFSIAILEAMASGLGILVNDVGGNKEQVIDKKNGYIVEYGNREKAVRKLYLLLNEDNDFGKNSQNMIKKKYTIEKTVRMYLSIYEKIKNNYNKERKL
ncbi:MAG: glycosyltransferase [Culicoidibacterales bacterium]